MGDVSDLDPEVLHIELCGAINDLAKSVHVAVARMKLRAECTAVIADTEKVENAAETLRSVAKDPTTQVETSLVPAALSPDPVNAIYLACTWLTNQAHAVASKKRQKVARKAPLQCASLNCRNGSLVLKNNLSTRCTRHVSNFCSH